MKKKGLVSKLYQAETIFKKAQACTLALLKIIHLNDLET